MCLPTQKDFNFRLGKASKPSHSSFLYKNQKICNENNISISLKINKAKIEINFDGTFLRIEFIDNGTPITLGIVNDDNSVEKEKNSFKFKKKHKRKRSKITNENKKKKKDLSYMLNKWLDAIQKVIIIIMLLKLFLSNTSSFSLLLENLKKWLA